MAIFNKVKNLQAPLLLSMTGFDSNLDINISFSQQIIRKKKLIILKIWKIENSYSFLF